MNSPPDSLYTCVDESGDRCRFAEEETLGSSRIAQEILKKVDEIVAVLGTMYNTLQPGDVQDMSLVLFEPMGTPWWSIDEYNETQKSDYHSGMFMLLIPLHQILVKNG